MLRHYIIVFLRNLRRQKLYAAFNITGLAIGFTTFILIALFVQHEYSYDQFHEHLDRIYRVEEMAHLSDGDQFWSQTCYPVAQNFMEEFPEVESAVVTRPAWGDYLSSSEDLTFYEPEGLYASGELFSIFSFEFTEGDPSSALIEPNTIVLTEKLADKYFPEGKALGQMIMIRNQHPFKVTGIIRNMPPNSSLRPDYICNINGLKALDGIKLEDNWSNYSYYTYVMLREGSQEEEFESKIAGYMLDKDIKTKGTMMLRPFSIIHLRPSNIGGMYLLVALYSMIAGLALLIASINFINLVTAYAETRGKEIGLKKVVGGRRSSLFLQFITESVALSLISVFLAFLLAEVFLPLFNRIVDRNLSLQYFQDIDFIAFITGTALIIGFLSGIYPALYLSSFRPIRFLRQSPSGSGGRPFMRKTLVVVQFITATFLILTTIMIYRQFRYHERIELGFNNRNVLFSQVRINDNGVDHPFDLIRGKLVAEEGILNATVSSDIPFNGSSGTIVTWEGAYEGDQMNVRRSWIHYEYLDLLEIEIVRGRNFSREFPSDLTDGCLINETAARNFGWDDPLGKMIKDIQGREYRVIGVVKDHHLYTTILKIPPAIMLLHHGTMTGTHVYSFKIKDKADISKTRAKIKSILQEFYPGTLFDLVLLKDSMDYESLKAYRGMASTIGFFSIITIGICVVGLLGLVAYSTRRRTKEIGIRKIHGASPVQIFGMLAREFVILLIIANMLALPLGAVNRMMDPAEIKVPSSPWEYLVTAAVILLVAMLTISYHAIKASLENPARSLKYE